MSETVVYNDSIIMDTFKGEVCEKLGVKAWDSFTEGIGTPNIHNEEKCGCSTMREFMKRFEDYVDISMAKDILTHVRHGLKPSQFGFAKEKFIKYNNIDDFIQACNEEEIKNFTNLRDTGEEFHGQAINDEVLEFLLNQPGMLTALRKGSELHITAFPSNMAEYLKETDETKKRYHACHCPFAKESILSENKEVSKTLCYCSLGFVKNMWEAIFDRELDGDVVKSALAGDLLCKYVIYLPKEIMDKYI
jgi:hypothetical protein